MRRLRFVSLAVILALCLSIAPLPSQTAVANPGDYNVPSSSYPKIQTAIDAAFAAGGGTVNVAAGNYAEHIEMKGGVIIQGSGANVTFIDGGGSGFVVKVQNVGSNAKLDGFTITGGNATISVGGAGGGIFVSSASPTISSCNITGNSADLYGGGIFVKNDSSPTISNCLITGNTAGSLGGGVFVFSSSPTVTNCTLTRNSATDGGGVYNWSSNPTITNSIIYGNTATGNGPNIFDSNSTPSITYSCVGGGYLGTGNINADPLFENPGAGNYHLQVGPPISPCIDTGNNNAPGILEFDLDGNDRKADGNGDTVVTVDMGAYEATEAIITYTITATADSGGSISPSGEVTVDAGDNQAFAILPDTGYHVEDVLVDNTSAGAVSEYTFINVTDNHTIHASFAIDTITIEIDIKPGSAPNSINPDSKGVIPVAILTTADFDAASVNSTTVSFGPNEASPAHYALEDVDDDGDTDMILHFKTQETGITAGDTEATLMGKTTDGKDIVGTDFVRIVPPEGKGKKSGNSNSGQGDGQGNGDGNSNPGQGKGKGKDK